MLCLGGAKSILQCRGVRPPMLFNISPRQAPN